MVSFIGSSLWRIPMSLEPLCPDPATWRIILIVPERDRLMLHLEPLRRAVGCPGWGTRRQRVPSRYHRKRWEVSGGQWPVQLIVRARRFFCEMPTCPRPIFVVPFPRVLARDARQTARLRPVLWALAHAS